MLALFKPDPSKKEIRAEEAFFGYKKSKPIKCSAAFMRLKEELVNNPNVRKYEAIEYTSTSIPEVRKSYSIWDYLGIDMQELDMISMTGNLEGEIELADLIEHTSSATPDKLPLSCRIMDVCEGGTILYYFTDKDSGDNYVLFQEIVLPPFGNEIASCVYAHEVAHTQMMINDGVGKDMLNVETIPMLMEQIAAYHSDPTGEALRHLRYFRLANMIIYLNDMGNKKIPFKNRIQNDAWIKSTIQAIKFANIYFAASQGTRKEMLMYINRLFNGCRNLDEMLSFYGIDFHDCNLSSLELKRIR